GRVAVTSEASVDVALRMSDSRGAGAPALATIGRAEDGLLLVSRSGLPEADDPAQARRHQVDERARGDRLRARTYPPSPRLAAVAGREQREGKLVAHQVATEAEPDPCAGEA